MLQSSSGLGSRRKQDSVRGSNRLPPHHAFGGKLPLAWLLRFALSPNRWGISLGGDYARR